MSADALQSQVEKLIGGWVAGTLTPAERAVLLEASLKNQALFDAMADEEGMRELLADPVVRRDLIALLAEGKASLPAQPAAESWWRSLFKPAPMAAFSAGVLAVLAFIVIRPAVMEQQQRQPKPVWAEKNTAVSAAQAAKDSDAAAPLPAVVAENKPAKSAEGAPSSPPAPVLKKERDQPAVMARAEEARRQNESVPAPAGPPAPTRVAVPQDKTADKELSAAAPPVPERKREADTRLAVGTGTASEVAVVAPKPAQVAADAKDAAGKAKVMAAAAPAPPPPPPLRYRVERQQPGGEWVEFGGELGRGAVARLAIDVRERGVVTVRSGRETLSVVATPGETVHYPASGAIPAEAGEREVAILFRSGDAAMFDNVSQSAQSQIQNYRQLSQTPGAAAAAGAGGGGARADRQKQAPQAPAAPPGPYPGEYAVTVRLRYR